MTPRTQKWLIIGGSVWLLVMIALIPLFRAAHSETESVNRAFEEYTDSLITQHFDAAWGQAGPDFQTSISYPEFAATYESLKEKYGPLQSVRRDSSRITGGGEPINWRAVIDTDLNYKDKTLRFELVFHKEGDRWVLFSMHQI